jgi:murein DD-endopeptidase MepM/ murein hydrolase activator NlpD
MVYKIILYTFIIRHSKGYASLFFVLLMLQNAHSQGISISKVATDSSIVFYASNTNYCDYQCKLTISEDFWVTHRGANTDSLLYFIVPPQTQKFYLFTVKSRNPQIKDIGYVEDCYLGNPKTVQVQDSTTYLLPFMPNARFRVIQGYDGNYSHRNQFALDFKMPVGTPIRATRAGIVVKVKKDSDEGGRERKFSGKANQIVIYQPDGTLSYYLHLKHQGSVVKVGDTVRAGQLIGYSGNTGWSTTPHLHYEVCKPVYLDYETIPTKFLVRQRRKTLKFWNKPQAK